MRKVDKQRVIVQQMSDQAWEAMIDRIPMLRAVANGETDDRTADIVKDGCLQFCLAEALIRSSDRIMEEAGQ